MDLSVLTRISFLHLLCYAAWAAESSEIELLTGVDLSDVTAFEVILVLARAVGFELEV